MDSMIKAFKDMLAQGELPVDPFEEATKQELSEAEKEALKIQWNNRIAMLYGGTEAMQKRMAFRRARRVLKR